MPDPTDAIPPGPPTEDMICAICGRVLDFLTGGGWRHGIAATDPADTDHLAVPVDRSEIPVRERCDFCFQDVIEPWVIPARSFGDRFWGSVGAWSACDLCVPFIQNDDWMGLQDRVVATWTARRGPMDPQTALNLSLLYVQLREHITGEPYRERPKWLGGMRD